MTITATSQLGDLLEKIAKSLDIPDEVHEEAVRKYEQVGHWLEEQDKVQGRRPPKVYPQGSFRLGTVIRPLTDKDEYDIDLVYERDLRKTSITQKELKDQAGEHLESYVEHCKRGFDDVPKLDEGRRCWTLQYADRFHMDVLPAIPNDDGRSKSAKHCETVIHITDEDVRSWQHSNPIGYAEWFKGQMRQQFLERRAALARAQLVAKGMQVTEGMLKEAAEQVPEFKVKTPLQRAVQILKRHRDFHFQNDKDNRPASIILTTLAAQAYDNEADLVDALLKLIRDMPKHIHTREQNGKRVSWVPNPVNDEENFADRWQDEEHPERAKRFRAWLTKVDEDLTHALKGGGIHKVTDLMGGLLGRALVTKAAAAMGNQFLQERQAGNLTMAAGTGLLGPTGGTKVKEHTFYGVDKPKEN